MRKSETSALSVQLASVDIQGTEPHEPINKRETGLPPCHTRPAEERVFKLK